MQHMSYTPSKYWASYSTLYFLNTKNYVRKVILYILESINPYFHNFCLATMDIDDRDVNDHG